MSEDGILREMRVNRDAHDRKSREPGQALGGLGLSVPPCRLPSARAREEIPALSPSQTPSSLKLEPWWPVARTLRVLEASALASCLPGSPRIPQFWSIIFPPRPTDSITIRQEQMSSWVWEEREKGDQGTGAAPGLQLCSGAAAGVNLGLAGYKESHRAEGASFQRSLTALKNLILVQPVASGAAATAQRPRSWTRCLASRLARRCLGRSAGPEPGFLSVRNYSSCRLARRCLRVGRRCRYRRCHQAAS